MRHLLILAVLLAGPAAAQTSGQTAGDRYGAGDRSAAGQGGQGPVTQRYSGRVLTWSGKTLVVAPTAAPHSPPQLRGLPQQAAFQPQAPLASTPATAPVAPRLRQAQAAPAAPPAKSAPAAPAAGKPLPTSLYGAAPTRGPVLAGGPPSHTGPEARFYSLHREYGLQPDAISEPPAGPRYILMGPPDHATAPKSEGDAKPGGVADAPF